MHRMMERQITDDEIRSYTESAKIMFSQWDGVRRLYVSKNGMAVIEDKGEHWVFKTAWKADEYDEDAEKIMEEIKNAGL